MPSTVNNLARATNFTTVKMDQAPKAALTSDPSLTTVINTNILYSAADKEDPAGTWVVDNQRLTAGIVVLSTLYASWLSTNTNVQSHLSGMSANNILSKAATAFSKALSDKAAANSTGTYSDLTSMATTAMAGLATGMTADEFVKAVLPTATQGQSVSTTNFGDFSVAASQYSQNRLTDNSVLQQKYDVATSLINTLQDAMSNLLKGWVTVLQSLAKGL